MEKEEEGDEEEGERIGKKRWGEKRERERREERERDGAGLAATHGRYMTQLLSSQRAAVLSLSPLVLMENVQGA